MESDEIGHPRVLVLDSKQMWLDAALLAPKGAFFAYSFSCPSRIGIGKFLVQIF